MRVKTMTLKTCDKIDASHISTGMLRKLIELRKYLKSRFAWLVGIIRLENSASQGRIPQKSIRKNINSI